MAAKTTKKTAKKAPAKTIARPKRATKASAPPKKKPTAATAKRTAPTKKKTTSAKSAAPKKIGPRADFGSPVDGYFAKLAGPLAEIFGTLRATVTRAVPGIAGSLKWGMPVYELDGTMICAMRATARYAQLILSGPPEIFSDPDGLLEGEGKSGRHLKLAPGDTIPVAQIEGWLAASRARR